MGPVKLLIEDPCPVAYVVFCAPGDPPACSGSGPWHDAREPHGRLPEAGPCRPHLSFSARPVEAERPAQCRFQTLGLQVYEYQIWGLNYVKTKLLLAIWSRRGMSFTFWHKGCLCLSILVGRRQRVHVLGESKTPHA